ncbi:MAG: GAF domain-containing protein [Dehalococcoidia bacterium]|nr:GAF domain-containing protein [Dehalococcoidia bacterium]
MLRIAVRSEGQEETFDHESGPVEFGRAPGENGLPRCLLADPFVSRNALRIEAVEGGRVRAENLSMTMPVRIPGGEISIGELEVVALPVEFGFGHTYISVEEVPYEPEGPGSPPHHPAGAEAAAPEEPAGASPPAAPPAASGPVIEAVEPPREPSAPPVALHELGDAPGPEVLALWFETLVAVQQAAATSEAFLDATARAVVDLVGLDRALVLLPEGDGWRIAAASPPEAVGRPPYSETIVREVCRQKRTVFRNLAEESLSLSLAGIDTVVAAPILDGAREVVGIVYGARALRPDALPRKVTRLEALVVQVLAAAVGAGLEREQEQERALRSQVQFEQFFSPELARELAADASMLEGREREVTVLFSDVRNFSRISERVGPQRTFAMMQDLMELQSVHIRDTGGTVVDYVGDGLLAMWNAPVEQPDHPLRACQAAVDFLRELTALSIQWEEEAGEPLHLGVGIHTGVALVGNTGSRVKLKYGPMGPTVNLASRLENSTKVTGVSALISRATRDRLPSSFATRRLGGIRVQGVPDPVEVYELHPGAGGPEWRDHRDTFERALLHFEIGQWSEACQLLAGLLTAGDGYDVPSLHLLSRSVECLRSRPEPFDPAMTIQKQTT